MKILISGYYGFGNLGDEAILHVLSQALKRANHSVTVLSHRPQRTQMQHNVRAVHRMRGVLSALYACDVLICGGGGLLQDSTSRRSLHYYLGIMRLALALKKRVIVYGQSIGPLSVGGEKSVLHVLQQIDAGNDGIGMRDTRSVRILESHGLSVEKTADPALIIGSSSTSSPPIDPSKDISQDASQGKLHAKPLLVIPRHQPAAIQTDLLHCLPTIARALAQKNVGVAALALAPEQDQPAVLALKQAVPRLEIWHAPTPVAAAARIAQAGAVVSVRLHGLILAAAVQVPFAGIVYDPKVKSFLADTGATAYTFPQDTAAFVATFSESLPYVNWAQVEAEKTNARAGLAWLLAYLD